MVAVTRCQRSFFYLVFHSYLLPRFHMLAFLQLVCLLSEDYSMELCSHRPIFHGLGLQCRSCHIETQESLLTLLAVTFHISHLLEHFILNFCLYHMLSEKITKPVFLVHAKTKFWLNCKIPYHPWHYMSLNMKRINHFQPVVKIGLFCCHQKIKHCCCLEIQFDGLFK